MDINNDTIINHKQKIDKKPRQPRKLKEKELFETNKNKKTYVKKTKKTNKKP